MCGDGLIVGTEICDDANAFDNQGCLSDCTGSLIGWTCNGVSSSTCSTNCGDALAVGTEQCDLGLLNDIANGCSVLCEVVPGWTCIINPDFSSTCTIQINECGDELVTGDEICDEGMDSIACPTCTEVTEGYECTGGSETSASVCNSVCGDGTRTEDEACDDGNSSSGDGCSSLCDEMESGYDCLSKADYSSEEEYPSSLASHKYDTLCQVSQAIQSAGTSS